MGAAFLLSGILDCLGFSGRFLSGVWKDGPSSLSDIDMAVYFMIHKKSFG